MKPDEYQLAPYRVTHFVPFNPSSKMTEGTVLNQETNERFKVAKGAPQVIIRLAGGHPEASAAVIDLAQRGLRALGVAKGYVFEGEDGVEAWRWHLVGLISLLDPPRPDSAKTIKETNALGVSVKMITGDQLIIAKEVAHRLGMNRTILDASKLLFEHEKEAHFAQHGHGHGGTRVVTDVCFNFVINLLPVGFTG